MMRTQIALLALASGLASGLVDAQTATIDLAGVELRDNTDELRTSAPDVLPSANGYSYSIEGTGDAMGCCLIAALFPDPLPLSGVFEQLDPGAARLLNGFVRNQSGTVPATIYRQSFNDSLIGLSLAATFEVGVNAGGEGFLALTGVDLPILSGYMEITEGSATVATWDPPAPVFTEWHFDGSLSEVADSGPSRLQYLDAAAFGAPLEGGVAGVTEAQSAFGTSTTFGIPGIGGADTTVYQTSPPRNSATPSDPATSRGIGLALYPRTADFWPEDKIGQWTMVWDLYIPNAAFGSEWLAPLVESNHNNEEMADLLLRNNGGTGSVGFSAEPVDFVTDASISSDQWMRLAVVCDQYQTESSRVYVDGVFIGTTGAEWLYNVCDPTSPQYADGEAVAPADWTAWGEFPNPWAVSSGAITGGATQVQSTACLFADRSGRGESVYVANMLFTDHPMSEADVVALGGPSADGIMFTGGCVADWDQSSVVDVLDLLAYLSLWFVQDPTADLDGSLSVDVLDLLTFLDAWFSGCA